MSLSRPAPLDESAWFVADFDLCRALDWRAVFSKEQPVEIDLGAGDGSFVVEAARQNPGTNYLAVERLLGRARKIARKAARLELQNLKTLRLESAYTMQHLIPMESVKTVHLMFPDPWPKRKQQKNRIVQPEFVKSVAWALEPNGEFRLTTDHEEYFKYAAEVLDNSEYMEEAKLWDFKKDPSTDFQRGFEEEGRAFYRGCWKKVD